MTHEMNKRGRCSSSSSSNSRCSSSSSRCSSSSSSSSKMQRLMSSTWPNSWAAVHEHLEAVPLVVPALWWNDYYNDDHGADYDSDGGDHGDDDFDDDSDHGVDDDDNDDLDNDDRSYEPFASWGAIDKLYHAYICVDRSINRLVDRIGW